MAFKQKGTSPTDLSMLPPDVVAAAQAESEKVQAILAEARRRPPTVVATPASIAANQKIMKALHAGAAKKLIGRIRRKELLTKEELIERLGGNRRWVNRALRAGRLFSLQAPSGTEYFPTFFADCAHRRRSLGRVAHALNGLPGPSKYFFFVSRFTSLQMSPLEAVALGRMSEVIECALAFAER